MYVCMCVCINTYMYIYIYIYIIFIHALYIYTPQALADLQEASPDNLLSLELIWAPETGNRFRV